MFMHALYIYAIKSDAVKSFSQIMIHWWFMHLKALFGSYNTSTNMYNNN